MVTARFARKLPKSSVQLKRHLGYETVPPATARRMNTGTNARTSWGGSNRAQGKHSQTVGLSALAGLLASFMALACHDSGSCTAEPESSRRAKQLATPARYAEVEPSRYDRCSGDGMGNCDIRNVRCQQTLFETIQCIYGTQSGSRPPVRFVHPDVLLHETVNHDLRLNEAQAPLHYAAQRLGLVSLEPSATRAQYSANAFYAARLGEVFFVERAAIPTDSQLAWFILGHEYVHALQDRDGELKQMLNDRGAGIFDRELAQSAAIEGDATLSEEILRALYHRHLPRYGITGQFFMRTQATDDAVLHQNRLLESSFGTFPYTYGASWAARDWVEDRTSTSRATSLPSAESTFQIMAARHGWRVETTHSCGTDVPPTLGLRRSRGSRDVLGAWLIQAYVRKHTRDAVRARAMARDTRGDVLWLYPGDQEAVYDFIWRTCWSSAKSALSMSRLMNAQLRESWVGDFAVGVSGKEVVAVVTHSRDVGVAAGDLLTGVLPDAD